MKTVDEYLERIPLGILRDVLRDYDAGGGLPDAVQHMIFRGWTTETEAIAQMREAWAQSERTYFRIDAPADAPQLGDRVLIPSPTGVTSHLVTPENLAQMGQYIRKEIRGPALPDYQTAIYGI